VTAARVAPSLAGRLTGLVSSIAQNSYLQAAALGLGVGVPVWQVVEAQQIAKEQSHAKAEAALRAAEAKAKSDELVANMTSAALAQTTYFSDRRAADAKAAADAKVLSDKATADFDKLLLSLTTPRTPVIPTAPPRLAPATTEEINAAIAAAVAAAPRLNVSTPNVPTPNVPTPNVPIASVPSRVVIGKKTGIKGGKMTAAKLRKLLMIRCEEGQLMQK
jgi:hypothetical protein